MAETSTLTSSGRHHDHRSVFSVSGKQRWKPLFEKYAIAYAVMPLELRGKPNPLVGTLVPRPGWASVFIGDNSVIFTRRTPGPRETVNR